MTKNKHTPVLLDEVLEYLCPKKGESFLDATVGYGGHAKRVLAITQSEPKAVLVDRDAYAVAELSKQLPNAYILKKDFLSASVELESQGRQFDLILADLGINSAQIDEAERGFAISQIGPLDMRMDERQELTAAKILNRATEAELTKIFSDYGEEPKARRIAKSIVQARPLTNTSELAAIATRAWPGYSRVHPATRIFQAIRIAVNDELNQLTQSLPVWLQLLSPGGRIAIISFHSLEDRLVKNFFLDHSDKHLEGELKILTKKPVVATNDEIVSNPRARSAKLRAAAKIKIEGKTGN
jgi:16S rRNA (cytosine1402-N4)-methyltransferase